MIDHYRTLGIASTADEAVIRAVYVALMKRFHPDLSRSAADHARAQAINEAYAVLSDPERRAAYDDARAGLEPWSRGAALAPPPPRRAAWPATMALLAAGAGIAYFAFASLAPIERRAGGGAAPIAATPARCAQLGDPERLRRALIVRLNEGGTLDRVAAGALAAARVETAAATDARDLARPGELACVATLAITLPAGFSTAAGERTILSELQYSVPRTDAGALVSVQPEERLVAALSAIRHDARLAAVANPMLEEPAPVLADPEPRAAAAPQPRLPTALPRTASPVATPRAPHSPPAATTVRAPAPPAPRAAGLGGVDRQTMGFYEQSLKHASAAKRAALRTSHNAFAERLAACGDDECRRSAYLRRNVEISRIMISQ